MLALSLASAIPVALGFLAFGAIGTMLWALLRHTLPAACLAFGIYLLIAGLGVPILFAAIVGAMGWGVGQRTTTVAELQHAAERTNAISVYSESRDWLGVLPQSLMYGETERPPFVALPISVGDVPPAFWICAVALEDARIDSSFTVDDVDFISLLRAWLTLFIPGHHREGASGLQELVDRSLRGLIPHPHAPLFSQIGRKLGAWIDAPGAAVLFPADRLKVAVATYIPLVQGAKHSAFGPEIHGIQLAARTLFGKPAAKLNDGEAVLIAAAINMPIAVARSSNTDSILRAQRRLDALKARGGRCLDRARFPENYSLAVIRAQLLAVQVPVLKRRADASDELTQPERHSIEAVGSAIEDIPRKLSIAVGPDWRTKVSAVVVPAVQIHSDLQSEFATAIATVAKRNSSNLEVPLWEGAAHPLVVGAVVDGQGKVIGEIGNVEGLGSVGAEPIGSIAKIVAGILRAPYDTPVTRYLCPTGPECPHGGSYTAREAFAQSKSATVFLRLRRNTEEDAQAIFTAFGLPAPSPGSARYNAAYGSVEATPEQVLRAGALLTSILTGHPLAAPLPQLVREIDLRDGSQLHPNSATVNPEPLTKMLVTPRSRRFVSDVLRAPVSAGGTLRGLVNLTDIPGVKDVWGKSGTADSSDHQRTRVVWNLIGFSYWGRPLTALLVVAGSNAHPLGRGFTASAITPLTAVLVRFAMKQMDGGQDGGSVQNH